MLITPYYSLVTMSPNYIFFFFFFFSLRLWQLCLFAMLDEVAYIFNIRASDVEVRVRGE